MAHVRGRGLVVLTGCGHAGIINILRYVAKADRRGPHPRRHRRLPPQRPLFEPIIAPTCEALDEFAPDYLVPTHCTGWRATHALAARFPDAFIQNSVGTRFEFVA